MLAQRKKPLIIVWDLETLPDPRKIYERVPSIGNWPGRTIKTQLHTIMSFGFKELGSNKTYCVNGWDLNEDWRTNDAPLIDFINHTLKDADQFVTHNGIKFDLKAVNTRLSYYGQPPLPKIHHVDTYNVAKYSLSLYSNSLDEVAKHFGCGSKISWVSKWDTWTRFAFGEDTKKDRALMDKYCRQDVKVLENVYYCMRPFINNKGINHNVFAEPDEIPVCPTCGSENFISNGTRVHANRLYRRLLCTDCGTWGKEYLTKKGASTL